MNRLMARIRAFFGLSRRETRGFLILLPLLVFSLFITPSYRWWKAGQKRDFTKENQELDSLLAHWKWGEKKDSVNEIEIQLFKFNPNIATEEDLTNLGFPSNLANRIENYRSKNGRFVIKSDLMKLYGMDSALYARLYPFIDLPIETPTKTFQTTLSDKKQFSPSKEKFDLNLADTTQLIRIYGIGSKLSQRIIKYRNALGGFISMNQLHEVYGLDSIVVSELNEKAFVSTDFQLVQIAINSATDKELAAHPYISNKLAKAIAAYRFQHGNFTSLQDLTKIALVDEVFYTKIKPYLTLNP
ncbi:MAG: helix-hairpin-helix domain-containing protein [Cyclobacteriaceae bacterium]|nr:helix-hairpin-helix domain-containing protein [Cyclobacteriaceae bacterium]